MVGVWGAVQIAQEGIMKTKLLTLFSLLTLLLVSTFALADGRPTGIRIGRAVSGGNMNVEIDVTVPNTDFYYSGGFGGSSTVWLGNRMGWNTNIWQYTGAWTTPNTPDPLPWAIEWGDGYYVGQGVLFGPSNGPWQGTFSHTYLAPGTYTIIAGDVFCELASCDNVPSTFAPPSTGYFQYGYRYVWVPGTYYNTFSKTTYPLAVFNTAVVNTGTGIPALNIYGLLAMAFVLVGAGLLVYRKPTVA